MSSGRDHLNVLHPHTPEIVGDEFRRFQYIVFVLRQGADTRDPKQLLQLGEEPLLVAGILRERDGR
jgi:hypothetical protein